ncbi:uncharacterized protein LOC116293390 [Actinia tenebrosa]|uniref:Uncharacterized protein LOC116293390 n=1 Tax=Actinia tenebrosa TaxID=6105 RepID=A0A6P8HNR3_ACTTE|nr:uncharacterized protein LOC116293390 [Actinia tenebrosa]
MRGNVLPQVTQSIPEYEAVQQAIGNPSAHGIVFSSSGDASQYQELNLLAPGSPPEGLGPTYEPLRTKSKDMESVAQQEQHPYESLDLKNKSSAYQSLQTINI